MTFDDLLSRFYTKITKKKIQLKANLDFIPKISNNMGDICNDKDKLKYPDEFISHNKMEEYLKKVPKSIKINGIDAQSFLRQEIKSINHVQINRMPFSNLNICGGIEFKIRTEYDSFFEESYNQWIKDSIKSDVVECVEKSSVSMISDNMSFQTKFDAGMKLAEDLRKAIEIDSNAVRSLFEELLGAKPGQATQIIDKVKPLIIKIPKQQNELIEIFKNVSVLLTEYNELRMKWADVLIGIRKSPTAPRKQLTKVFYKNLSKEIRNEALRFAFGVNYVNKKSSKD